MTESMDRRVIERVGARRRRGERGAVLVEAAIVLPILFMMIFGIMEIGSALKSYSGASNAVRAGGRMASVAGNDVDADRAILERMATESAGVDRGDRVHRDLACAVDGGDAPGGVPSRRRRRRPTRRRSGRPRWGRRRWRATSITGLQRRRGCLRHGDGAGGAAGRRSTSGARTASAGDDKVDCNWPGKDRKTTVTPRGQTPPAGQSAVAGLRRDLHPGRARATSRGCWATLTITDASVNLIEPQGYSVTT